MSTVSAIELVSPYLKIKHRRVSPLRGVVGYASEAEQKQRASDVRKRLIGKPPKPLQMATPVVVEKSKQEIETTAKPVEKSKQEIETTAKPVENWDIYHDPAPYDLGPSPFTTASLRDVPSLRWKYIIQDVALKHRVTFEQITGRRRTKHIVLARHEAIYRLGTETQSSLPSIGRKMGGLDHTTCLYAIRMHKRRNGIE